MIPCGCHAKLTAQNDARCRARLVSQSIADHAMKCNIAYLSQKKPVLADACTRRRLCKSIVVINVENFFVTCASPPEAV